MEHSAGAAAHISHRVVSLRLQLLSVCQRGVQLSSPASVAPGEVKPARCSGSCGYVSVRLENVPADSLQLNSSVRKICFSRYGFEFSTLPHSELLLLFMLNYIIWGLY